jgi:hypothetical protein
MSELVDHVLCASYERGKPGKLALNFRTLSQLKMDSQAHDWDFNKPDATYMGHAIEQDPSLPDGVFELREPK